MIFTDLKKAFDTVDHEILLKMYGVIGTENAWFACYLSNRMQFPRVNGVFSGLDDTKLLSSTGLLSWTFTVFDLR